MRTLILAEPGGTHEGRLETMLELIGVAAEAGADCYKSQWTSSAQTMCDRRHAPEYLDSYLKLQYPLEWHAELRDRAKACGLQYGCSVYISGDAERVASFVDYLKVSSFETEDVSLIRECINVKPADQIMVSLGMGAEWPMANWQAQLLHCVSSYPASLEALNLATIRKTCGVKRRGRGWKVIGVSDHSHDVRVGAWAVAAGATILETHFRLMTCDPANKDYAVAFTPAEFKQYIQNVRDCEAALGDGVKRVQEVEKEMLRFRVTA